MNAADLIRMEIKRLSRPGVPPDMDTVIEAAGAVIDRKFAHAIARISRNEEKLRDEEA